MASYIDIVNGEQMLLQWTLGGKNDTMGDGHFALSDRVVSGQIQGQYFTNISESGWEIFLDIVWM